jgi:cell division protease FtsH
VALDRLAALLLEKETVDGVAVTEILRLAPGPAAAPEPDPSPAPQAQPSALS